MLATAIFLARSPSHAESSESKSGPCDSAGVTILIVRHADRAGTADSLSAAGVVRSRALVEVVKNAGIRAIYHSDTRRNRDTAAPLAAARGIPLEEYPAKDIAALIARIVKAHRGETVLVVGHSNTVPMIIAAAHGPAIPDIPDNEFDGLFIVHFVPACPTPGTLTQLQYGAPSP